MILLKVFLNITVLICETLAEGKTLEHIGVTILNVSLGSVGLVTI